MKSIENILLFFVILGALIGAQTYPAEFLDFDYKRSLASNSPDSNNFDILIFAQSWLPTVCYKVRKNDQEIICNTPINDNWIIHGIWPMELHTIKPVYCDKSLKFDSNALKPIEDEMRIKWMIPNSKEEPFGFWEHEWDKHGTCSVSLKKFRNQQQYFKTGLELFDKYNIKQILTKAQIFPGHFYPVDEILESVFKILGKRIMVACTYNSQKKQSYLYEIRICFDKALKLIDCDGIHAFPTNCDKHQNVIYPEEPPMDMHLFL